VDIPCGPLGEKFVHFCVKQSLYSATLLTVQRCAEHERALAAYMKYPKKREGEKGHQEAIDELYVARKKFHQVSLI